MRVKMGASAVTEPRNPKLLVHSQLLQGYITVIVSVPLVNNAIQKL